MRSLLLACGIAAALTGSVAQAGPASSSVVVEMRGFRNASGKALVALFASRDGFPDHPKQAVRRLEVPIHRGTARAVFARVPPGTYAVAVLHDEDGDRAMKTGLFGIPKEGYGASQDARGSFGPPSFGDAAFALRRAKIVTARIAMVYH
jgi:uncharacterized protein (DUF2141 family)